MNEVRNNSLIVAMIASLFAVSLNTALLFLGNSTSLVTIPLILLTVIILFSVRSPRELSLLLVFGLVAWFPEYSQTDLNARTAADAPTIYNYRPLSALTVSAFDYLFAMVVLLWLIREVFPNPTRLAKVPYSRAMAIFFFVWVFNLIHGLSVGNPSYDALREFRNGAYFVITYLMVTSTVRNMSSLFRFFRLEVALAVVIGAYGVLRYFLGLGMEFMDHVIVFYDIADSLVLSIGLFIIASVIIEGLLKGAKLFVAMICCLPIMFTFVFSLRRGAWLGFAAGLVFMLASHTNRVDLRRIMLRRVLSATLVVIVVLAIIPPIRTKALDFIVDRAYSIFDVSEDPSNVFRIMDAMNALRSFTQHPVIGVGAGGRYELEFVAQDPVTMDFMEHVSNTSHDGYLYILFKAGVLGFVSYFSIFVFYLKDWFRLRRNATTRTARAAMMAIGAIVIAILVTNVTEPLSDLPRPSILLAFVMGWGAILMQDLDISGSRLLGDNKIVDA